MPSAAKIRVNTLDNATVARLPDRLWRRYLECQLLAFERNDGGLLPPLPDMAFRLHQAEAVVAADLDCLTQAGLLEKRPEGCLRVAGFRQSLTNAERQSDFRERRKRLELVTLG